ncbi:MAG: outer membrane beta-barrel protein [Bacteroidales bacterium]|nr:outer membrane beta-barrel protein [Bacteroidales bacterium]
MKKISLLLIGVILFAFSFTSIAGGKYGLRGGYQLSNIYNGGNSLNKDPLNSFYVGMFTEQRIVPMLSFGSGSEYSQIGSMTDNNNKVVMHYLSIPTYLKFKIGPFFAIGGASASFKVYEQHFHTDAIQDPFEKAGWFDIPVYAGVGLQFLMIRIEARYNWGTFNLYDSPNDGYKNQYLQLGLAVAI